LPCSTYTCNHGTGKYDPGALDQLRALSKLPSLQAPGPRKEKKEEDYKLQADFDGQTVSAHDERENALGTSCVQP